MPKQLAARGSRLTHDLPYRSIFPSMSSPPVPLRIRVGVPADAPMLAALGARLFRLAFASENTLEDMAAYLAAAFGPAQQHLELSDAATCTLIVESNDSQIGYAQVRFGRTTARILPAQQAEIARFYIDPDWHGRGVAAALMDACLESAREWGADAVWLGVWERNPRAIAFYRKYGFDRVGEQRFRLGRDLQTDHVMARSL